MTGLKPFEQSSYSVVFADLADIAVLLADIREISEVALGEVQSRRVSAIAPSSNGYAHMGRR
jgi:hypothetical protein